MSAWTVYWLCVANACMSVLLAWSAVCHGRLTRRQGEIVVAVIEVQSVLVDQVHELIDQVATLEAKEANR